VIAAAAASPATTNTAANPNQAFGVIAGVGAAPVSIQSPPVVNFTVIDTAGKFVPGLKLIVPAGTADPACSTSATATTGHVTFAIAKLNKPTDGSPSTWQNLISRQRIPANTATQFSVLEGTTDPKPTATVTNPAGADTDASKRIVGILEENTAGGYYTYRFATDVVTPLAIADAVAGKGGVSGKVANNGNVVVKDGKTIYRIGAQLCYTDPASKAAVVVNPLMDFTVGADGIAVPVKATDGKTITDAKKVVDKASCNECHSTLKVHGTRVDPNYCVMCHNPGSTDYNTNNPIDLKYMVHAFHMGKALPNDYKVVGLVAKGGTGTATVTGIAYPQNAKNCVKCHTGTAAAAGSASGTHATADGDNWQKVPSRNACGGCHNGINFAANTGVTIADAAMGLTSSSYGHVGGAKSDDTQCAICHTAVDIPKYHLATVGVYNASTKVTTPYARPGALPTGAYKIEYNITSVTMDATTRKVSVNFQIKKDGSAVNFGTYNATTNPNIIPNMWGGPSLAIAYNVTQDSNTSPADTNTYVTLPGLGIAAPSVNATTGVWAAASTATSVWANPVGVKATSNGANITWKMTGPDATNTYTITNDLALPKETTIVRAIMYGSAMAQTNLSTYPYANASAADSLSYLSNGSTRYALKKPGLLITQLSSVAEVKGMERRVIVSTAKCNSCHEQLVMYTQANSAHSASRNDPTMCSVCHNPNNGGQGNMSWGLNFATFIHGIHASGEAGAAKRQYPYTFAYNGAEMGYPGVLKNCEQCHVAGSYDFSATANAAAASKLLFTTVGTGTNTVPATGYNTLSPYVTAGTAYGAGFGYTQSTDVKVAAAATTLVNSPIAAACFSCHDSAQAKTHMSSDGGGSIYEARSTALLKTENCLFCHGSGKLVDIKVQHAK
jgi:OmcA/MtrC family decaheme c-type cytochrome